MGERWSGRTCEREKKEKGGGLVGKEEEKKNKGWAAGAILFLL